MDLFLLSPKGAKQVNFTTKQYIKISINTPCPPATPKKNNFRRLIPANTGHKNLSSKPKPENAGGFI